MSKQEQTRDSAAECVAYFKKESGWNRLFPLMKRKWESLGRPSGTILLKNPTEEERRSAGVFIGRKYSDGEIRYTVDAFVQALENSKYCGVEYKELLDAYFGETICTKMQQKQKEEEVKECFYTSLKKKLLEDGYGSCETEWIDAMVSEQKYGYMQMEQLRKAEDENRRESTFRMVTSIFEAYAEAEGSSGVPLAILSALVSGNPHYFDRGTLTGNLFAGLCCFRNHRDFPTDTKEWKELLATAHILPDEVASTVMTYGIHLQMQDGSEHPGASTFARLKEPLILSSLNLQGVSGAYAEDGNAWVVENEMVFSYLLKRLQELPGPPSVLLCTSGQLRTASWELLGMLSESGTTIHYSGDLDPEGILIADRIVSCFPNTVKLWHMSKEDYLTSISGEEVEDWRLKKLDHLQVPELRETADLIRKYRKAGYQENLLLKDKKSLMPEKKDLSEYSKKTPSDNAFKSLI